MKLEEANARRARLLALADAYEPGNWALCDGVDHIYRDVPSCCQTLRDDLRAAIRGDLAYPAAIQPTDAGGGERVYVPWIGKAINPLPDPLATAINRYAGPGRELFEMIYARLRELEGR